MAKLIAKRVLSMMLVMIFVFTTFCFADLGFTSVALADKQGLITSGRPTVEFYVPETIYLKPGTTNTYQYFADEDADGNVINNVADDTEGNFSFRSSVPFSTLTITRSDDPNVTYTADNTSLLTGSFRTGNAAAGTLVEWRAEYVIEDRTYESFAYSYVYATSLDQSGLLWFQSHSGDMLWWDTNPYVGA